MDSSAVYCISRIEVACCRRVVVGDLVVWKAGLLRLLLAALVCFAVRLVAELRAANNYLINKQDKRDGAATPPANPHLLSRAGLALKRLVVRRKGIKIFLQTLNTRNHENTHYSTIPFTNLGSKNKLASMKNSCNKEH